MNEGGVGVAAPARVGQTVDHVAGAERAECTTPWSSGQPSPSVRVTTSPSVASGEHVDVAVSSSAPHATMSSAVAMPAAMHAQPSAASTSLMPTGAATSS